MLLAAPSTDHPVHRLAYRFQSVTDRFLKDLNYIPEGLTQNNEANIEHIVRCMRWVRLKVYPMEAFEDAAELLESMSRIFDAASGERIKRALAQTLNQMLEAIVLVSAPSQSLADPLLTVLLSSDRFGRGQSSSLVHSNAGHSRQSFRHGR